MNLLLSFGGRDAAAENQDHAACPAE